MDRRKVLTGALGAGGLALLRPRLASAQGDADGPYGPLEAPNADGLRLPAGFQSRVVARTGTTVAGTNHIWHGAPDGGATFSMPDGGWVYVSNAELSGGAGGAGMIRFDSTGTIVEAGTILSGTDRNCAGGATPWGTWLSCEEWSRGAVWECDPLGLSSAQARPAMGLFQHEAAAADPERQVIYMTEDRSDGCLYRFVPDTWGELSSGELQVLTESGDQLGWAVIPDPSASQQSTRFQVSNAKRFNGGEGAWYDNDSLYFTTKGDNRVWRYDVVAGQLEIIYDWSTSPTPILSGVDNITVSPSGDLFVCEDGGNMEIVMLTAEGSVVPFLRSSTSGSELAGVAFDPSGTRLYVSSQRNPGETYEITGPFRLGTTLIGGRISYLDNSSAVWVAVDLFEANADGFRGTWLGSTVTGEDGTYGFEVEPGCYIVTQIAPDGEPFERTGPYNQLGACVERGENNRSLNGTLIGPSTLTAEIGGTISYVDQTPAVGVSVDLFEANSDQSRGQWLESTQTDENGRYRFIVPPGCFVVTQIAPTGESFLFGYQYNQRARCVESGQISDDLDGVLDSQTADASIGGLIAESDGQPVSGILTNLYVANADGLRGQYVRFARTEPDGRFTFEVAAGCYIVVLVAPFGRTFVNGSRYLEVGRCVEGGEILDDIRGKLL